MSGWGDRDDYGHHGYGRRHSDCSYSSCSRDDSYYRHRRDDYRDDWGPHHHDYWDHRRGDDWRRDDEWRRRGGDGYDRKGPPVNPPKERRRHDNDECCQIF